MIVSCIVSSFVCFCVKNHCLIVNGENLTNIRKICKRNRIIQWTDKFSLFSGLLQIEEWVKARHHLER